MGTLVLVVISGKCFSLTIKHGVSCGPVIHAFVMLSCVIPTLLRVFIMNGR